MSRALLVFCCCQGMKATSTAESDARGRRNLALDSFPASADPFSWKISTESLPQFVLLSITGGVTPLAYDLYRTLADIRHQDGCPIETTWFVSIAQGNDADPYTLCNLITGLRKGKHEIATNTYGPTPDPTEDDIMRAVTWLNETCGVPLEEMRGFRTPGLGFAQRTFDRLHKLDFLYDSSIADDEANSNGGRSAMWPYTMDWGIAQNCITSSGSCNQTKPNPGLWELPLWRLFDEDDRALMPVDWTVEDSYSTLAENFARRYEGNRAPLAINIHAGWLVQNGGGLRRWAEEVLEDHDDVFFITMSDLIEWMRNPVAAGEYSRDCTGHVTDCFPPPYEEGGCGNGKYDTSTCECVCIYPFYGPNCLDSPETWTVPPTISPTDMPTVSPTELPTSSPTISHAPTTSQPTLSPTITAQPTQPTESPTYFPTQPPVNVRGFSSAPKCQCAGQFFVWAVGAMVLHVFL